MLSSPSAQELLFLPVSLVEGFLAARGLLTGTCSPHFQGLLGIFTGSSFSETANNPLNVIASSFSNGAVFFVGYSILIIGTQIFFELAQFMIPWFLYLGVRKATTPRQRFVKSEPRRFFHYTVGPNQTLVIAIILTFSLLNPLPICFIFIYFTFAMLVFKDHVSVCYFSAFGTSGVGPCKTDSSSFTVCKVVLESLLRAQRTVSCARDVLRPTRTVLTYSSSLLSFPQPLFHSAHALQSGRPGPWSSRQHGPLFRTQARQEWRCLRSELIASWLLPGNIKPSFH